MEYPGGVIFKILSVFDFFLFSFGDILVETGTDTKMDLIRTHAGIHIQTPEQKWYPCVKIDSVKVRLMLPVYPGPGKVSVQSHSCPIHAPYIYLKNTLIDGFS